jgi:hypothetical protein
VNHRRLGLSGLSLALLLSSCSLLPLLGSSGAERDESGTIVDVGAIDAFSFQLGDCLMNLETTTESQEDFGAGGEYEVTEGFGVPCSSTHIYEVYHVEPNGIQSASELSQADLIAEEICYDNFESFAAISFESTSLGFTSLFPTNESFAVGDREITCLIYADGLAMVTGSLEGKGPNFVLEVASYFRAGECLNGLEGDSLTGSAPIPVACQDPHLWEVYYTGSLDDDLEPPLDVIAQELCIAEYSEFIGVAWEMSSYTFSWFQPNEETYRFGDRKVACLVHSEEITPVSGSLKGIRQ